MKKVYLVVRIKDGFDFDQKNVCCFVEHEIAYVSNAFTVRKDAFRAFDYHKKYSNNIAILVYDKDGFITDLIH